MRCCRAKVFPLPTGPRQKLLPAAAMASSCVVVNVITTMLWLRGPKNLRGYKINQASRPDLQ